MKKMADNFDRINTFHNELLHIKEGQTQSKLEVANEAFLSITANKEKSETELKAIETFKVELLGDYEKNIVGQKQRFDTIESEIKNKKK